MKGVLAHLAKAQSKGCAFFMPVCFQKNRVVSKKSPFFLAHVKNLLYLCTRKGFKTKTNHYGSSIKTTGKAVCRNYLGGEMG